MKIAIIAHNLWGVGGTVRTVYNLAEGLAATYPDCQIDLISVYRRSDTPSFSTPPGCSLSALIDGRRGSSDRDSPLYYRPSLEVPPTEELFSQYSELTDHRLIEYLKIADADVIIGTRPSINLVIANYAPPTRILIAQEHSSHETLDDPTRHRMAQSYGAFDAVVAVTETDARAIRQTVTPDVARVVSIPNSVPAPHVPLSDGCSNLIIGAGRVVPAKRFELLIHAFAGLARNYSQWNVRIYGTGKSLEPLRGLVNQYGLAGRVRLMGSVPNMGDEWTKGAIAVSTSDAESFGMTLVEAMRAGVPLISTDCPNGPREIVRDPGSGVLIPTGDVDALRDALRRLMDDEALRRSLAEGGHHRSLDFSIEHVSSLHMQLIRECAELKEVDVKREARPRPRLFRPLSWHLPFARSPKMPSPIRVRIEALRAGQINVSVTDFVPRKTVRTFLVFRSDSPKDAVVRHRIKSADDTFSLGPTTFGNDALWRVTLEGGGAEVAQRGVNYEVDGRALLNTETSLGPVHHAIPYVKDGGLLIQAWKRNRHVELTGLSVTDECVIASARSRFDAPDGAKIKLIRRIDSAELVFPCHRDHSGTGFSVQIPVAELVRTRLHTHDYWDAYYVASDGTRARVGQLIDDIPQRRAIDRYPTWTGLDTIGGPQGDEELVRVRPYFTPRNNLALSVVCG